MRYLVHLTSFLKEIKQGKNLADLIHSAVQNGHLENNGALSLASTILRDKLKWETKATIISESRLDFHNIVASTKKWNKVSLIVLIYFPFLQQANWFSVVNPKKQEQWDLIWSPLVRNQLIQVYAQTTNNNKKLALYALDSFHKLLKGEEIDVNKEEDLIDKNLAAKKSSNREDSRPTKTTNLKVTPLYNVQVTNDVFHNGNVEAWKNVIESYCNVHPDTQINVYYEGELIRNLNSLFQWGKVKNKSFIFFQVRGSSISQLHRLQKSLFEAASPRFKFFLKKNINISLNIF